MNGHVEVTSRMWRIIAHSLVVRTRVSEAYIHFALIYTTYHIFPVLPIKNMIKKDSEPTTPFKLAIGMKTSVSHFRVLFCPYVVQTATAHVNKKALSMRHQAQ